MSSELPEVVDIPALHRLDPLQLVPLDMVAYRHGKGQVPELHDKEKLRVQACHERHPSGNEDQGAHPSVALAFHKSVSPYRSMTHALAPRGIAEVTAACAHGWEHPPTETPCPGKVPAPAQQVVGPVVPLGYLPIVHRPAQGSDNSLVRQHSRAVAPSVVREPGQLAAALAAALVELAGLAAVAAHAKAEDQLHIHHPTLRLHSAVVGRRPIDNQPQQSRCQSKAHPSHRKVVAAYLPVHMEAA
mmetsp:Transcript_37310/g.68040  ORF Transcript_37310/g.68040 Transcript_37310/m.68040 type:complete len:244 (+) Transcript_37310:1480-2211(+)